MTQESRPNATGHPLIAGTASQGKTPAADVYRAQLEATGAQYEETTDPESGAVHFRVRRAEA
ncbi:hypothetical protein ACFVGY_30710 [Streptomyces sp. NPDC127106]|uniref:hypothetical protein n=1 Tax=Streptomyces sp. NPDC127106 TaxID=3345360 RepID=UPI003629A711